jgi:hypothetical protein
MRSAQGPAGQLTVVIVMARCRRSGQAFGIRFEEVARGQWQADWTFAVGESAAKREGYDRAEVRGDLGLADAYPGCPHCGEETLAVCGCDRVMCWDGQTTRLTCPWCRRGAQMGGGSADRLTAGRDL